MTIQTIAQRVLGFLRTGYPDGVHRTDYIPLLALLRRKLTDEEVHEVAEHLIADGILPASLTDIGAAISGITDELPSDDDTQRVTNVLLAAGWPLHDD